MTNLKSKIISKIEEYGLGVIAVSPDPNEAPPFAYSIGLSLSYGHEILVEGLPPELSHYLINEVAQALPKRGIPLSHSCVVKGLLQDNMPIALVEADSPSIQSTRTIQVSETIAVDDYSVLQIIIPDPQGVFPWESEHNITMGSQEIHRIDSSMEAIRALMASAPTYDLEKLPESATDSGLSSWIPASQAKH